jgi:hypothetical protein
MLELWKNQEARRKPGISYQAMELSELQAIYKLAIQTFGNASERYAWKGSYRYGAVIEAGKEEPGVLYVGFFLDGPSLGIRRRRELILRGCSHAELLQQARLWREENAIRQAAKTRSH